MSTTAPPKQTPAAAAGTGPSGGAVARMSAAPQIAEQAVLKKPAVEANQPNGSSVAHAAPPASNAGVALVTKTETQSVEQSTIISQTTMKALGQLGKPEAKPISEAVNVTPAKPASHTRPGPALPGAGGEIKVKGKKKRGRPATKTQDFEGDIIRTGTIRRMMKLDRDVKMMGTEAVTVVAKATELFLDQVLDKSLQQQKEVLGMSAQCEEPVQIEYNSVLQAATKDPRLDFLAELLPEVTKRAFALLASAAAATSQPAPQVKVEAAPGQGQGQADPVSQPQASTTPLKPEGSSQTQSTPFKTETAPPNLNEGKQQSSDK
eukprot:CAMPEP_0184526122 /NCGR_PEP_ID=MMETSP0198_2-20121128/10481_1 /TAXON_ID=1112570 /ORGANISM="Thraustochytrium sp., Strain LLF1b" /LENGTH=319 /DNA_ID=CAMNT_0026917663 /DNA_START=43 /DNA_END=1003 /DNA_ORIENTATION=-